MADVNSSIKAYSEALFSLTEELHETETVLQDAQDLLKILNDNQEYLKMLDSPALSRDERLALIDKSLSSLNKNLVNLTKLLAEKRLSHTLPNILEQYVKEYEISRGIEHVEVISAVALTEAQRTRLKIKLEGMTGKQIIISYTHDPSLLGGMKLRYMGIQLDGSVKSKLDGFSKSLAELVI